MPSLNQFKKLDADLRKKVIDRILFRQRRFLTLMHRPDLFDAETCDVLIVGDRPAPSAPDDPSFHYTPFGALWNSSLYINLCLEFGDISEARLTWINSADFHGEPTDYWVLDYPWQKIITLGGAGEGWLKKSPQQPAYQVVPHPSYWKRFHSKLPYPLIPALNPEPIAGTP